MIGPWLVAQAKRQIAERTGVDRATGNPMTMAPYLTYLRRKYFDTAQRLELEDDADHAPRSQLESATVFTRSEVVMIAVIFEVFPAQGRKADYLKHAARLRSELECMDGFISARPLFAIVSSPTVRRETRDVALRDGCRSFPRLRSNPVGSAADCGKG